MEINRNNYEIFFLDYLDGTLTGKEIDSFLDFVSKNPDLKSEMEELGNLKISVPSVEFAHKNSLYKNKKERLPAENYQAVAYLEGDLSREETNDYLRFLDFHPEQAKELELYAKTHLEADESIVFPNKRILYRKHRYARLIYSVSGAAAILLVAFAIWSALNMGSFRNSMLNSEKMVAEIVPDIPAKPELQITDNEPSVEIVSKPIATEIKKEVGAKTIVVNEYPEIPKQEKPHPVREKMEPIQPVEAQIISRSIALNAQLAVASPVEKDETPNDYLTLDQYLVKKVLNLKKEHRNEKRTIFETGMQLANQASKNRIQYESEAGKITKLSLDTKLLAFSVPLKKEKN